MSNGDLMGTGSQHWTILARQHQRKKESSI
jgi:hypothetical protein